MSDPNKLVQSYKLTHWLIHKQAEGLTHAESLLQLPFRGNCFNWVLGHILVSRDEALALLGEAPTLTEAEAARYKRGSDPITDEEQAVPLEKLLQVFDTAQERLVAALPQVSSERWTAIYNEERQQSVGDRVAGLHWHETYHSGQLDILRQLAGKNDAVI